MISSFNSRMLFPFYCFKKKGVVYENRRSKSRRKTMKLKTKILLFLLVFALVDTVIPVPLTAILLMYVLWEKPAWFPNLVREVYDF